MLFGYFCCPSITYYIFSLTGECILIYFICFQVLGQNRLPKIHKTPIAARFIVASDYCSMKPLSDTRSKLFKTILNTVESFHTQSLFHSGCEKFWVVQNSFPIATKLKKSMLRKKLNLFRLLSLACYLQPSHINSS